MISEQRVKLMTRLAAYEKNEGKKKPANRTMFAGFWLINSS